MSLGRDEADVLDDAGLFDAPMQPGHGRAALGARRAADDRQQGVSSTPTQLDQRLEGQVDTLQILESPDEQQHRRVGVDAERLAGLGPIAGREEGVFDAERHDVHSRRVGVVEANELLGLDVTAREHRVGAGEDRRLLESTVLGLGFERVRLHTLERVKGHDEWNIELVLQTVTSESAQPVVGVDRVGGTRTAKRRRDRVGEFAHERGQLVAFEGPGGTGRHVVDPKTGLDADDVALVRVVTSGVDVHLVAEAGQRTRELAHVDVHPSTVTGARLGQRRGVIREDRETCHASSLTVKILIHEGKESRLGRLGTI